MHLELSFEESEIEAVKAVVEEYYRRGQNALDDRRRKNVESLPLDISREDMWEAHMMGLLTSVQRSGTGSAVDRFLSAKQFPVPLEDCQKNQSVETLTNERLKRFPGIRFTTKIPEQVAKNFAWLEKNDGWKELEVWRDRLHALHIQKPDPSHYRVETQAAEFVDEHFVGFGPKQSRNFWQTLGLTRYSFVLDSRVIGWVRKNLTLDPGLLTAAGLSDIDYYLFVSSILMDLCARAGVFPCVFDAAAFDSYEKAE